jgi:hypothetical protein
VQWERVWKPTTGRPFNKQFEPILHGDWLLNVEPLAVNNPRREADAWNYLHALNKKTGVLVWVAEDALTHYNTPIKGHGKDGWSILQGRGGYHDVPETPIGLSLTSLERKNAGKTLWRHVATGKAQYNMYWDARHAYWIDQDKATHTVLDARTGKVLRTQTLDKNATWRRFENEAYVLEQGVNFSERNITVFPAWFTNITHKHWHYFLCFSHPQPAYGIGPCGPMHCVGRVHIETGSVEYLELPIAPGTPPIYGKTLTSSTVNSRGIDIMSDPRSRRDGWHWSFLGSPTAVGNIIFWTTMLGVTYAIDGNASVLDERALLSVNDLGPIGETWSLSAPTHDKNRLYHRSMKEVVCIG